MTHRVAWVPFCRFCCLVAVSRGVQRRLQLGIRIAPLYNTAWVRPGPRLSHISGRLLSSSMVFRSRPSGSAGQPGTAPFFNHSVYRFYWGCGGPGERQTRRTGLCPAFLLCSSLHYLRASLCCWRFPHWALQLITGEHRHSVFSALLFPSLGGYYVSDTVGKRPSRTRWGLLPCLFAYLLTSARCRPLRVAPPLPKAHREVPLPFLRCGAAVTVALRSRTRGLVH